MSKFKPGDRVIAGWEGPGEVIRAAKVYAQVRFDNGRDGRRMLIEYMRAETDKDVTDRQRRSATLAWQLKRPHTKLARVEYSHFGHAARESGAQVGYVKTPDDMRAAAAELLEIAAWFDERPVADDLDVRDAGGANRE